jgi:hypothetical protein
MVINKKRKFVGKTAFLKVSKKKKGFFFLEILLSFVVLLLFIYHIINCQKTMMLQIKHLESMLKDTKTTLEKINKNKKVVGGSENK